MSVIIIISGSVMYYKMFNQTAVLDNRREKIRWTITPFVGLAMIFLFCMVPMVWYMGRNTRELVMIFSMAILPLSMIGLWYHLSIPSFVIMDANFIFFDRCKRRELLPTPHIVRITRPSRGTICMKMRDGSFRIREGIDDAIIHHLTEHINVLNPGV